MARTALVTGGAAGIGRACSLRLASQGHAVGILDVNFEGSQQVAAEIEAAGGRAIPLQASVSDRGQVTAAVEKLHDAFGPVTIAVNNAGIPGIKPFREITDDEWDRMMEVNLKGTFVVTQIVLPDMEAAHWGRIVNISSSCAQTGTTNMAHYSASKGGVVTLTRTLARELGPLGITVNNIAPGCVMNTVMSEANRTRFSVPPEEIAKNTPVRRNGIPDDIADSCLWLCSEASGFVNGQTIGINGGVVAS